MACIYCYYKTQADQKADRLAAAILRYLIQERSAIPECVVSLYDRHADRGSRPSIGEILSALRTVISSYSKVYVVFDALDECQNDDRTQILTIIRNLQATGTLNLMATSRFIPEIESHFSSSQLLEIRADDSDVRRFVAGQMYRLPGCVQRDHDLQKYIQYRISKASEGI